MTHPQLGAGPGAGGVAADWVDRRRRCDCEPLGIERKDDVASCWDLRRVAEDCGEIRPDSGGIAGVFCSQYPAGTASRRRACCRGSSRGWPDGRGRPSPTGSSESSGPLSSSLRAASTPPPAASPRRSSQHAVARECPESAQRVLREQPAARECPAGHSQRVARSRLRQQAAARPLAREQRGWGGDNPPLVPRRRSEAIRSTLSNLPTSHLLSRANSVMDQEEVNTA